MIVPIWKTSEEKSGVLTAASSVERTLKVAGLKVKVDDSEQKTPGWKFNFWEMKVRLLEPIYILSWSHILRHNN